MAFVILDSNYKFYACSNTEMHLLNSFAMGRMGDKVNF